MANFIKIKTNGTTVVLNLNYIGQIYEVEGSTRIEYGNTPSNLYTYETSESLQMVLGRIEKITGGLIL